MKYVIQDAGEFFVDFLEDGLPIWCKGFDARREFSNRAEAIGVRDTLNKTYKLASRVIDMTKPRNKNLYALPA